MRQRGYSGEELTCAVRVNPRLIWIFGRSLWSEVEPEDGLRFVAAHLRFRLSRIWGKRIDESEGDCIAALLSVEQVMCNVGVLATTFLFLHFFSHHQAANREASENGIPK
jgi:hypothetical protein